MFAQNCILVLNYHNLFLIFEIIDGKYGLTLSALVLFKIDNLDRTHTHAPQNAMVYHPWGCYLAIYSVQSIWLKFSPPQLR